MPIRAATASELDELAVLAARCQAQPSRQIPYVDDDAAVLAEEVAATAPGPWWERTRVMVDEHGRRAAWLLADVDEDMGRTWWNGPFVDPRIDDAEAATIADALYAAFPSPTAEQELSFTPMATWLVEFAERHGFAVEEGSALLAVMLPASAPGDDPMVRELGDDAERAGVAGLHDVLFPATHTTGAVLAAGDDDRLTLGRFDGDRLVGYVSVEFQPGDALYVDFVGVRPDQRGRGHGAALIAEALTRGADHGCTRAHLTVRVSNAAARRLYAKLQFVEVGVIIPARKGFSLT